jgi:hypothetical protein
MAEVNDEEIEKGVRRAEHEATNALRQTLYSQEMSALRSLQVLNAGGAVALLAFLGQTWIPAPELRIAVVVATCLFGIGSLLAVAGGFLLPTYFESRYRQNESSTTSIAYRGARRRYHRIVIASLGSFVLAVTLLLVWVVVLSSCPSNP